jgi:lipopolysaccharide export system protein LptA
VRVLRDCRVVISGLMGSNTTASAEASTNVTVITSKEMFLDYKDRSVLFEKDVCVEDPQLRLLSDTMKVGFSEKNEISWIVAEGAVRMFHEGREANAGKAVYDVATDEFLLEDNPKLIDGRNTLVGEKIRFRRASGQMVCEPSARLVVFPDKNLKTDLFEK